MPANAKLARAVATGQTSGRIDQPLREAMTRSDTDQSIDFIIHLDASGNLSDSKLPQEKDARRHAVVAHLQAIAGKSQADLLQALEKLQTAGAIESYFPLWVINGVLASGRASAIQSISMLPGVSHITLNRSIGFLDPRDASPGVSLGDLSWGLQKIRARHVWSGLGVDGQGVTVAILDTGVDWNHPALHTNYRGLKSGSAQHVGNWFDAVGHAPEPRDPHGHGTHVTGTAVGTFGIGVAPGANWIAARVLDQYGVGKIGDIHKAFQWLLAPAGDPDKAPDIVNGSWGSAGDLPDFVPDIMALRAAGIMTVFAAGNEGPEPGTIGAPASYAGTLAIGASDDADAVAWFSSRGPSPLTDQVKPSVVAPGAYVLSALPGGEYGYRDGTSMATPHAAGTLALLLAANPELTEPELTALITGTAVQISGNRPDNASGWGRLDAYAAVSRVAPGGLIQGMVKSEEGPVAGIAVTIVVPTGAELPVYTDIQGYYHAKLQSGTYGLKISAFGFEDYEASPLTVLKGETTVRNVELVNLPGGRIEGVLRDAVTGNQVSGTVKVADTPILAATDSTGRYKLLLPAGTFELVASARGHRLEHAQIETTAGAAIKRDFDLPRGPDSLLVDSGRWYYRSQVDYFTRALEQSGFRHDLWTIQNPVTDLPTVKDLAKYDVVVWTSPTDSPGYVGASEVLSTYLGTGGDLLVSGQDVGELEQNLFALPYWWYRQLGGEFLANADPPFELAGAPGTLFDGLNITLNGKNSADNQDTPEQVRPRTGSLAKEIFHYSDGTAAALQAGQCLPHRVVYLGFGLEGVDGADDRAEIISRSYSFFAEPDPIAGVSFLPEEISAIAIPGSTQDFDINVTNLSKRLTDTIQLGIANSAWPSRLMTTSLTLGPCQAGRTILSVETPDGLPVNSAESVFVNATSSNFPDKSGRISIELKTPGHILLVDDDRWYDQEPTFRAAMDAAGYSYDLWETGEGSGGRGSPTSKLLAAYDFVIWYTGYDWLRPVTIEESKALYDFLSQGGRLFMTSQDYLYYHFEDALTRDFLGIRQFKESVTPTLAYGGTDLASIGGLAGPLSLDYGPYQNFSDGLVPAVEGQVSLWHDQGSAAGVSNGGPDWRAIFWALPFETLPADKQSTAITGIMGWLSDLGDTSFEVDRPANPPVTTAHDDRTFTLTLRSLESGFPNRVWITNTIPLSLELKPETVTGGASYDPSARQLTWEGVLGSGEHHIISYITAVKSGLPPKTRIDNSVTIYYERHGLHFRRVRPIWIGAPDLSQSILRVYPDEAYYGQPVTYALTLTNEATVGSLAFASLRLPDELTPVDGSLTASGGSTNLEGRTVEWQGTILPGEAVTVTVLLTSSLESPAGWLPATVVIRDGVTDNLVRDTLVHIIPYQANLPVLIQE